MYDLARLALPLKSLVLASVLFLPAASATAGTVWLSWNANAEPDVAGYVVLWGTASGSYSGSQDVGGRTTALVPDLQEGRRYYFAVRAYNGTGREGPLSAEVSTVVAGTLSLNDVKYLAEGAQTRDFWDTYIALLNPENRPARVVVTFQRDDGSLVEYPLALAARSRATVRASQIRELSGRAFSTRVESDVPLVVDRTMSWDRRAYGAHGETAVPSPSARWYLTEGATGPFSLFYLLSNPGGRAANVRITYLLESGRPVTRTYSVAAHSRRTIFVNGEAPRLASTPVSGVVESTNAVPIIAERAMYLDVPGRPWAAGSASVGVTNARRRWLFAEGAANDWFDLFYLFANPNSEPITVTGTYLLPGGGRVERSYRVPAHGRRTIHVNADRRLSNTPASVRFESSDRFLAERSMWWPRTGWYEANSSDGVAETGTAWAFADGESGGAHDKATYVLIANTGSGSASVRLTVLLENGKEFPITRTLPANSRTTWDIAKEVSQASGRRYGVVVESLNGAPLVVERASYWSAGGLALGAGTNAVATRLRP